MDIPDPTTPINVAYERYVNEEKHTIALSNICSSLAAIVLRSDHADEAQEATFRNELHKLNTSLAEKVSSIQEKQERLDKSKELSERRKDKIVLPLDKSGATHFNLRDLKGFVGDLDKDPHTNFKPFYLRLKQYGENQDFSWENYKSALSACFDNELLEQYLQMENSSLDTILTWFWRVYHRPADIKIHETKLRTLERFSQEPIDVFMERYNLYAMQADKLLPPSEQLYTNTTHSVKIMEKALTGTAKKEFIKWRTRQMDGGLFFTYKDSVQKAVDIERDNSSLPKQSFFIDCTNSSPEINQVELNAAISKPRQRYSPYTPQPRPNRAVVDHNKAQGNRASFYHNLKKTQNQPNSFPAQGRNVSQGTNFGQAWRKGLATGMNNRKRRNNFSNFRQNKVRKQNFRNTRNNYNSNSNYNPQRSNANASFQPFQTSQRSTHLNQQFSNFGNRANANYKSNSSNTYNKFGSQASNFRSKSYSRGNAYNNGNKPQYHQSGNQGNRKVKGRFCKYCGVHPDMDQAKSIGSTHSTTYCKLYRTWNPNFCDFCLKHKNLLANHYPKHCLQQPSSANLQATRAQIHETSLDSIHAA